MAKNEKLEALIPEIQDRESLIRIADSFESMAQQLRFAAEQIKGRRTEVVATSTCRRSYGFVQNWVGNVFQAISSIPTDEQSRIDAQVAEIKARAAESETKGTAQKTTKSRKKKAE